MTSIEGKKEKNFPDEVCEGVVCERSVEGLNIK